jgi:hypothetical protein
MRYGRRGDNWIYFSAEIEFAIVKRRVNSANFMIVVNDFNVVGICVIDYDRSGFECANSRPLSGPSEAQLAREFVALDKCMARYFSINRFQECSLMNLSFKPLFQSLAIGGGLALVVSSAIAQVYDPYGPCYPKCSEQAQAAYQAEKIRYAAEMTRFCNTVSYEPGRASCLAAVPSASEGAAQNVYGEVLTQCMRSGGNCS